MVTFFVSLDLQFDKIAPLPQFLCDCDKYEYSLIDRPKKSF